MNWVEEVGSRRVTIGNRSTFKVLENAQGVGAAVMVKSTCFSCRGPGFRSQNLYGSLLIYNSGLRWVQCLD